MAWNYSGVMILHVSYFSALVYTCTTLSHLSWYTVLTVTSVSCMLLECVFARAVSSLVIKFLIKRCWILVVFLPSLVLHFRPCSVIIIYLSHTERLIALIYIHLRGWINTNKLPFVLLLATCYILVLGMQSNHHFPWFCMHNKDYHKSVCTWWAMLQ